MKFDIFEEMNFVLNYWHKILKDNLLSKIWVLVLGAPQLVLESPKQSKILQFQPTKKQNSKN